MISKITVGTSATLVSAKKERTWFIMQNQGAEAIFVGFGPGSLGVTTTAGGKPGISLAAGEVLSVADMGATGHKEASINDQPIYAVVAADTEILVIHEG